MAKSWGAMRKKLEQDNICDSLRGRITYYLALYHRSHDGDSDNFIISVDGKKVFETGWYIMNSTWYEEYRKALEDNGNASGNGFYKEVNLRCASRGDFDRYLVYHAFYEYDNQSIEDSLCSENPVIRLFAFYDKRTGKRRLEKLAEQVRQEPKWLYDLIKIRYDAEEIKL